MSKNLIFTTSTELIRLPADAIVYIAADGSYSTVRTVDGSEYVLTMQLGQMEKRIAQMVANDDLRFIRIGKSLIVNREYIAYINPVRQKIVLSDARNFKSELSASKEALRALKLLIEKEDML